MEIYELFFRWPFFEDRNSKGNLMTPGLECLFIPFRFSVLVERIVTGKHRWEICRTRDATAILTVDREFGPFLK